MHQYIVNKECCKNASPFGRIFEGNTPKVYFGGVDEGD